MVSRPHQTAAQVIGAKIGVCSVPLPWSSRSVRSVWMGREIASDLSDCTGTILPPPAKRPAPAAPPSVGAPSGRDFAATEPDAPDSTGAPVADRVGTVHPIRCISHRAAPDRPGNRQDRCHSAGQQPTCGQAVRAVPGLVQEQISQGLGGLLRLSHARPPREKACAGSNPPAGHTSASWDRNPSASRSGRIGGH